MKTLSKVIYNLESARDDLLSLCNHPQHYNTVWASAYETLAWTLHKEAQDLKEGRDYIGEVINE